MNPTTADVADVLDRAAAVIEFNGLCQGRFWFGGDDLTSSAWRPGCACCVSGAVAVARGIRTEKDLSTANTLSDPAIQAFARHLALDDPVDIFRWNDDPLRTVPGVVRSLREAAGRIRCGDLVAPS